MTYLPDLHTYLHQSSLLLKAYPTSRISTKYSLPRKPSPSNPTTTTHTSSTDPSATPREKRDPSATLTLKTFHPESGICLKYRTDKAQEVGRLMAGLGRLAKGEVIEMPSAGAAEKMDVDVEAEEKKEEAAVATTTAAAAGSSSIPAAVGGGGKKKKKGKGGK